MKVKYKRKKRNECKTQEKGQKSFLRRKICSVTLYGFHFLCHKLFNTKLLHARN